MSKGKDLQCGGYLLFEWAQPNHDSIKQGLFPDFGQREMGLRRSVADFEDGRGAMN